MRTTAIAGALLVIALAGCAQSPQAEQTPDPPATENTNVEPGPLGLVNLWRVSDAEGESDETWLRLDAHEFQLWRDCGMIQGTWSATETLLLATVFGALGDCGGGTSVPRVPWLEDVTGYHETFEGWALLDGNGDTVATLSIDGAPEPIDTAAEFYAQPPEITEDTRAVFAPAVPLPEGIQPAGRDQLLAFWVPVVPTASRPNVEFRGDGTWGGSDGCNESSGAWVADGAGGILTTSGPSTLMACEGAAVPSWVAMARSAGLVDEHLVLFDAQGTELGRLMRG